VAAWLKLKSASNKSSAIEWQTPQSSEAIGLAHPVPKAIQMK